MKAGMTILRPLLAETGAVRVGTVVLGTVKGDIHDIGKNLVGMMLEGAGFEVIDLGINTDADKFIAALEEHKPDILGMSALLTTTMPYMKVVIDTLQERGLRDKFIVLVGGAPVTQEYADAVAADGRLDIAPLKNLPVVRDLVTVICRVWCRMTIEGRHNVPKSGVFILAPTHRSILDTPITASLRRKRLRFMAADKWWKNEALGKLITALGGFPVSRGTADREALKRSIMLIDDGEPLVLFPEGERKSGPEVQPLFDGATYIAMKAGVPIIPVAIGGSERAMPKGAKFIYPRSEERRVGKECRSRWSPYH